MILGVERDPRPLQRFIPQLIALPVPVKSGTDIRYEPAQLLTEVVLVIVGYHDTAEDTCAATTLEYGFVNTAIN